MSIGKTQRLRALTHLELSHQGGGCIALIGSNGAGKSTLLRGLVGAQKLSEGEILIGGELMYPESPARRHIGYLSERIALNSELSVQETIWSSARSRGLSRVEAREALDFTLRRCQLNELSNRRCGTLSRGQRQRVRIAEVLVHRPALLVLDEVHSGLDPLQTQGLNLLISELTQEHLIILSTHRLSAAQEVADLYWVLERGCLIAEGPLSQWDSQATGSVKRAYQRLLTDLREENQISGSV